MIQTGNYNSVFKHRALDSVWNTRMLFVIYNYKIHKCRILYWRYNCYWRFSNGYSNKSCFFVFNCINTLFSNHSKGLKYVIFNVFRDLELSPVKSGVCVEWSPNGGHISLCSPGVRLPAAKTSYCSDHVMVGVCGGSIPFQNLCSILLL